MITFEVPDMGNGYAKKSILIESPNGGGICIRHIIKIGLDPKITENEVYDIQRSVQFFTPTISHQQRIAYEKQLLQQQQANINQQKLENLKRKHQYENRMFQLGQIEAELNR